MWCVAPAARLAAQVAVPVAGTPAPITGTAAQSTVAPSANDTVAVATSPAVASDPPGTAELSRTAKRSVAGAVDWPGAAVTAVVPL